MYFVQGGALSVALLCLFSTPLTRREYNYYNMRSKELNSERWAEISCGPIYNTLT